MTTNQKISELLNDADRFKGVYLYDELEQISNLNDGVIVINYVTRKEADKGIMGHYVVFDNRQGKIKNDNWPSSMFFDPYGIPPDVPRAMMNLPNTQNISKFIRRILKDENAHAKGTVMLKINDQDFQSKKPWDDLCGVYSVLFVKNPNYQTNEIFSTGESRPQLDQKLEHLFRSLHVLDDPLTRPKKSAFEVINNLSSLSTRLRIA